jgi:type III secretory pathway component EscV
MSTERSREAEAFRAWFTSQKRFTTLAAMERALNITPDYLNKIRRGDRQAASELRQKLYETTGLEAFKPIVSTTPSSSMEKAKSLLDESSAKQSKVPVKKAGIETLTREIKALRRKVDDIDTRLAAARVYQDEEFKKAANNATERAKKVANILVMLSTELEFFKRCSQGDREIFKKVVQGPDVGYITTLLRALYDEDKFQRWLLFSTYDMKGNSNE